MKAGASSEDVNEPMPVAQRLLDTLKPWKELIAILLFFGSGLIWVTGYFATKKQLDSLECFARESVALARAETSLRSSADDLLQRSLRVDSLENKQRDGAATESEKVELRRLLREIRDLEKRRDAAVVRMEAAQKTLEDGKCMKEPAK